MQCWGISGSLTDQPGALPKLECPLPKASIFLRGTPRGEGVRGESLAEAQAGVLARTPKGPQGES